LSEIDQPGLSAVGCNAEPEGALVVSEKEEESPQDDIIINEAFLPHGDKDMASNTRVDVDSRGGYFIDDVTESRGDTVKCDESTNKSTNSNVKAAESHDVLHREEDQPIGVGYHILTNDDSTVMQPAVQRVCSGRKERQITTRGQQCDDVQFTMEPLSGSLSCVLFLLSYHSGCLCVCVCVFV